MALTPRENYLNAWNHKETEWTPVHIADCAVVGFGAGPGPWIEKGPYGGGYDGFGVRWLTPSTGGGAAIPAPNEYVLDLDNLEDWRNIVKFPDLEAIDWKAEAEKEYAMYHVDRNNQAVEFGCGNGVFERLAALMGFENALISMVEEPEICYDLMEAITDYKIELAKKVKEYYNPDLFTNYDDIATERGPFMSAEVYRKLIKPHHKRLHKAVRELGMIPVQHTCGYCEPLIEDMIETGAAGWTAIQPTNDIVSMQQKYGDKFIFMGGYNSNGEPGLADATMETKINEIHRCIDVYGKDPSFVFFGFVLVNSLNPADIGAVMMPLVEEAVKYSRQIGRK